MNIEPVGTTLAVVAIVASATVLLGWKRAYWAVSGLVLAVPFRDFVTRWLNAHSDLSVAKVTAIGRWWFVVVATLLVWLGGRFASRLWRKRRIPKPEPVDLLLALVLVLSLLATVTSSDLPAAITSFRGYMQPLAVFVLARAIGPSRREIRFFLVLWLIVGLIMAGLALWQATAWTEADYRSEGYVRQDGELVAPYAWFGGQRYLRPASTVSGPNELGVDMVLLFLLAVHMLPSSDKRLRVPLTALALIFAAGVASSLSRSAFLGFVISLIAGAALIWPLIRQRVASGSAQSFRRAVLGAGAAAAAVLLILGSFGIFNLVGETVVGIAREYHYVDAADAVQYLLRHPQGVGMGLVEPKGALALIEAGGTYHVEGSLFQIAMEMGVWGLAAWLAFWGVALARIYRNFHALTSVELRVLTGTAFAGWLGSLVAFLFLPLMQSISLMVWLWFLLGVGYQSRSIEAAWQAAEPPPAGS